jgi:hypothetical protein
MVRHQVSTIGVFIQKEKFCHNFFSKRATIFYLGENKYIFTVLKTQVLLKGEYKNIFA